MTPLDRLRALHAAATASKSWVSTDVRTFYRDAYAQMPSLLACADALAKVHHNYMRIADRIRIAGDDDGAMLFYASMHEAFNAVAPLLVAPLVKEEP